MPSSVGPYQTRGSNLVFAYDVGDVVNSYIGEPTTNLANFNIASSAVAFNSDTPGNLTQTANSSEATYQGRLSRKMVVGSGYWNAYIYGYDTGVSSAVFAVSYKVKTADGSHPNTIIGGGYIYGSAGAFYPAPSFTYLNDGWYLATILYAGSSMVLNSITGMYGSGGPKTFYIVDYQAETKTHATPFTPAGTTRSNTQGLLDISGYGNTLTLDTSYDANAMMYFDGTDDKIVSSNAVLPAANNSPITLEAIAKTNNASGWQTVLAIDGSFRQIGFSGGYFYFGGNTGGGNFLLPAGVITPGQLYHLVMVYDGVTAYAYKNGILITGGNIGTNGNNNGVNILSSYRPIGGEYLNGSIPIAKAYSRALSSSEVTINYNSYKKRFNLS